MRAARYKGFTLIEMMVAIAVAAVLLAIAIPGMQALSRKSQQRNAIGDISSMVARARSEAATRYQPITICATADQSTCSGAATWETGWLMFVDLDSDQQRSGTGEDIVQVGVALPSGSKLAALYFPSAAAVTFQKGGLPQSTGTFRFCIYNGAQSTMQAINVSASGQVRVATDSNADGALENNAGTAITACP